jgi:predicted MPP superfamily phosphohydrolase
MFHPAWPPAVVYIWGTLDSALCIFFFMQIPCYLFFRYISVKWRQVAALILVLTSIFITAAGSYECVRIPRVKEITLCFKDLPKSFDGYRIAQLSDLHCSQITPRSRFEEIVRLTNASHPDLICLTGDYVDGWVDQLGRKLEPISSFNAPDGVLAVPGNHEYYWDWEEWRPFIQNCGISVLENSWTNIVRGSDAIVVAGLPDVASAMGVKRGENGSKIYDRTTIFPHPDHVKAFAGAPDDSFRILLFHRPHSTLLAARSCNVKLQLSGHTHGGAFPGLAWFVSRCNERHVRGLYKEGDLRLYVSPGTGQWAGFPIRLLNPAEITVFTLKRNSAD